MKKSLKLLGAVVGVAALAAALIFVLTLLSKDNLPPEIARQTPSGAPAAPLAENAATLTPAELAPSLSPTPTTPGPTSTPEPGQIHPYQAVEGWQVYISQDGGYAFSYPSEAAIVIEGVTGFPTADKPENTSFDDYVARVQSLYPGDLCVQVKPGLGFLTIQHPAGAKYGGPCGVSGIGDYEVVKLVEEIQVGGEAFQATKYEVYEDPANGQAKFMRNEFYVLALPHGYTLTFGGDWKNAGKIYQDYLPDKAALLQILASLHLDPQQVFQYAWPEDQVIFTIPNPEPASGIAGEPAPDWLGWGAQAYAFTGGEFWLLDNAAQPQRLLRIVPEEAASRQALLSRAISLEGITTGAIDLAAYGDSIWLLENGSPPRVVQLGQDGELRAAYDLPEGLRPENGVTGLALNPGGELLVELEGGGVVYRLFDDQGNFAPQRLDGRTFGDTLYQVQATLFASQGYVKTGNTTVEVSVEKILGGLQVLGDAPDGSFYVEIYEMEGGSSFAGRRSVRRYNPSGELLGVAYPLPAAIHADKDLIVASLGNVYQLVSNADHSVQVVKLGFRSGEEMSVVPTLAPTATPAPVTALLPEWTGAPPANAAPSDLARHTLVSFFTFLHDKQYAEAEPLFGGSYDFAAYSHPSVASDDYVGLWAAVCDYQTICMSVHRIVEEEQVAEDEFHFLVEFVWMDGSLFKLGGCCGATEAEMPAVWQFPYTVKRIDGQFKVMETPVILP